MNASAIRVVLCTCPPDAAAGIARDLLDERLAACVSIVPGVRSLYRWQGQITDDGESLLIIKTKTALSDALEARLVEVHPYEVPEVLSLQVADGAEAYLTWVMDATRS